MNKETLSTSDKEVPKHKNALEEKYQEHQEKEPLNPENIQKQKKQLPDPSGWRLLVLPFTPKEKTKGGTLKAPTKSKTSGRRKSFCARMGGMKKRLTSAKTARDPNSRINKALRKWKC